MFVWAIAFLVITLISAVFGFGDAPAASAGTGQIMFLVFAALFVFAAASCVSKER